MTTHFDPGGDFARVIDRLVRLTLIRPGTLLETAVDHALSHTVRTREAQRSGGRYTSSDVVWHLPAAELPDEPRPGDVLIEASGRRWTILDVQQASLRTRWRCVCRRLAIRDGLNQQIRIERATYHKTAGGAEEAVWQVWRTAVPARIQPLAAETTGRHDRDGTAARFRVFCGDDLRLDHTYRIRGPDGTAYRIAACRKSERIDAVMEIDVVRLGATGG